MEIKVYPRFSRKETVYVADTYTLDLVRSAPNVIFVFGDNVARSGCGGQAIIRHEPNAFGIRTKYRPSNDATAFFGHHLAKEMKFIADDIFDLHTLSIDGKSICFPAAGLGTGRAQLKEKAPAVWKFMQEHLKFLEFPYHE